MARKNMEREEPIMHQKIKVFISYAREDDTFREQLDKQLSLLKRNDFIDVWHNHAINAGVEWEREIATYLNTAHIILLLVSPDFIASDDCYSGEMIRAIERHERGEAQVIPVILRPVIWQDSPFGKLRALPKGAESITSSVWHTPDEAFFDVAKGIQKEVEKLRNSIPSYTEQRNSRTMPPGTLLLRYTGHANQVTSVAWSPDGNRIASASSDGIAQVWQPDDGEQSFTFNVSNRVPSLV